MSAKSEWKLGDEKGRRPWMIYADGKAIATLRLKPSDDFAENYDLTIARARRIITAVNCHEELVGLVEEYRELIYVFTTDDEHLAALRSWKKVLARIDATLAKAREGAWK